MSLQPKALGALFEMDSDAVLGINNNNIISFANPAAVSLLGAAAGKSAARFVPQCILDDPRRQFIASVTVAWRHGQVTVSRLEEFSLLRYTFPATEAPPTLLTQAVSSIADSLMIFRLSLEKVIRGASTKDKTFRLYAATLCKEYYLLKRLQWHLAMAAAIQQDNLPFDPEVTDLAQLCQTVCDSVRSFFQNPPYSLTFQTSPGDYFTYLDPALISSMLLNLLSNSISHIEAGGAIQVTLTRQGNLFILSVDDTGCGIPPEAISAAFNGIAPADNVHAGMDPPGKLGTGLPIAKGVAERHGGTLILESRPGHGTSVRVSLPYREPDILTLHSPRIRKKSKVPDLALTEFSVILDREFYTDKMID